MERERRAPDLRDALDELRHVLDVTQAAARTRRRRRAVGAVLAVAALIALAVLAAVLLARDADRRAARPPAAPPGRNAAAPTGRGAVPPPGRGAAPHTDRGDTAAPGPPGSDVEVHLTADGADLEVVERLRLDAPSFTPLALEAASFTALGADPRVVGLTVHLDGVPVRVSPGAAGAWNVDGAARWSAPPPAGRAWEEAVLRYRIAGAVALPAPAGPGRALGIVTPLTARISAAGGRPVTVRAPGRNVVGVSCPTAPRGTVCGLRIPGTDAAPASGAPGTAANAGGWTASLPPGAAGEGAVVLVQLDLPAPRGLSLPGPSR